MYKITAIALTFLVILVTALPSQAKESRTLEDVLAAQSTDTQTRFSARNPKETLQFFGITPGMAVGEALPGGGWYSKILLPYLGNEGQLVGVNYPDSLWSNFSFITPELLEKRKLWPETWPSETKEWGVKDGAAVSAYTFATMPESTDGTLDAMLFVRALHNLARFSDEENAYLNNALAASYKALKPGGIVGIVQHQANEDRSDEWADGSNGYLKKSFVISEMEKVGFELVAESDINANPLDQAKEGDFVWRLPPRLAGAETDEDKAAMRAIGESNRMTLKFRKPNPAG